MHLIIISGRSGSGKSSALHLLEDEGYYCIDNLPVVLLPQLVSALRDGSIDAPQKVAVCIDARNASRDMSRFSDLLKALPDDVRTDVVYLDADDHTLIKRFSETRRRHPLSDQNTALAEAIARERQWLEPIASTAGLVLEELIPLVDRVYAPCLPEEAAALAVAAEAAGTTFVPELTEGVK